MRTPLRGPWPALTVILVLVMATSCKDNKETKTTGPATPAVEGATQVDPEALHRAVNLAVERRLADAEASRIGDKDRGEAARLRTVEARLARFEDRIDALERKASLGTKDDPEPDVGPKASGPKGGAEAPPTVEPEPDKDDPGREPSPKGAGGDPETDVVEAPTEDIVAEPAEADGEQTLGFHPAPLPEDGEDAPEPTLILTRAAVAPSIDRDAREPVDAGTVFDASVGKIYAFMVFKNPTEDEHEVTVVWKKDGKELSRLPDLKVGPKASRWRTWAYVSINDHRRGDWAVEVLGPGDTLLGSVLFKVE